MIMDLSICIVNWNGAQFIIDCIQSIISADIKYHYEIIVVDNDSEDNSPDTIERVFPEVKLIRLKYNPGFSRANNIGIEVSLGAYVLILNPDTIVEKGSLEAMIDYMECNEEVGICGPCLIHPETDRIELSYRAFPHLFPLLWNLLYIDRILPRSSFFSHYLMTYMDIRCPTPVDWVTGACMLVRASAIKVSGPFDDNFFMYCEDIEWCLRLRKDDYKTVYLPGVKVFHFRGQSSKLKKRQNEKNDSLSIWGVREYTKSIIYFYQKHYGFFNTQLLRFVLIGTALFKALVWIVGGISVVGLHTSKHRAFCYLSAIPVALGIGKFER